MGIGVATLDGVEGADLNGVTGEDIGMGLFELQTGITGCYVVGRGKKIERGRGEGEVVAPET